MKTIVVVLVFLVNYISGTPTNVFADEDELISVVVFYRHGDRTPDESFPNDKYFNITFMPMGLGELTKNGMDRQYKLGQWLRNRYDNFLPKEYSRSDIYVFSTDTDRTLMSAAANLAGLYPPDSSQIWNQELMWQPIPIHSIPREIDQIITEKRPCAKYDSLYKKTKKEDYFVAINAQYADLFALVSNLTGWEVKDIKDIKELRSIFYCYANYNSSFIPEWAADLDQDVLDYLSGVTYERNSYKKKMKRFLSGPFFYHIISHFDKMINQTADTPKFLMIAAHDTSMTAILDSMGVYDFWPPDFASAVMWELRKKSDGNYYLNVVYKKTSGLATLTVKDCEVDCDFEVFKTIMEPVSVDIDTWEIDCEND